MFFLNKRSNFEKKTHEWNYRSNTLHTEMIYSSNFSQGFATLPKSLRHDSPAIIVHIKKILEVYLIANPKIEK